MSKKRRIRRVSQPKLTLKHFAPKTDNQQDYLRSIIENVVTIGYGPAGTGKSYLSVGLACDHLYHKKTQNIIVAKPIVGCGSSIGALPGDMNSKIHPYLAPSLEYFELFMGKQMLTTYLDQHIKMYPVELVRGHTYHDSIMILEEAQNCTAKQIKLFLSRIGQNSRAMIIGDNKQSDIYDNGLQFCIENFTQIKDINVVQFDHYDIVRNKIIAPILEVFDEHNI